jgi:D-methionine transport system permease protein
MFSEANVELLRSIIQQDLLKAIGETLFMTFVPTILAFIIGLPLGVLLVTGEENGIRPIPRPLLAALNAVINLLRSVPFLILLVVVLPLSKLVVGTTVGSKAIIVPLAIAAFPFIARLVETSIREVDQGVVEAAQAMGASPWQITRKVLIPEAKPALISNFMVALITIFGYGAMAGILGGGGLGAIAINYGYYRRRTLVMLFAVILLIIMVQIFQSVGNVITKKTDKRIR